jgi:hypothetical protein
MGKLIGSVKVTPPQVAPGQSVQVQVLDPKGAAYTSSSDVTIALDGVPVPSRYYQFPTAGNRTITVYAAGQGTTETSVANVTVTGTPLSYHRTLAVAGKPAGPALLPFIMLTQDFTAPYQATFALGTPLTARFAAARALAASDKANAGKPAPAAPPAQTPPDGFTALSALFAPQPGNIAPVTGQMILPRPIPLPPPTGGYEWTFGDGQRASTDGPTATHDYFQAITPGRVPFAFDVSCHIIHDQVTVTRTLVLYSPYGACQCNGTTVPYVIGDTYATLSSDKTAFSALLFVYNIENTAITIDEMAIIPVWSRGPPRFPAYSFTKMAQPVTIAAHSSSMLGMQVLRSQLSGAAGAAPVTGFIVVFQGTLAGPRLVGVGQSPVPGAPVVVTPDVALRNRLGLGPITTVGPIGGPTGGPIQPPAPVASTVRFSWNVQLWLQDQQLPEPVIVIPKGAPWLLEMLGKAPVLASTLVKSGGLAVDPATSLVSVAMSSATPAPAQASQVRHSVLSVLNTANTAAGAK